MNSLDFFLAAKWLEENLPGAKVEKGVFRRGESAFSVEFYSRTLGGKRDLAFSKGAFGFLESADKSQKGEPWKFGREFLSGRVVERASQVGFDRILRIDFSGGVSLVHEAFSGNLLILKSPGDVIAFTVEKREWRGRKVFPGEQYLPPSSGGKKGPLELSESDFSGACEPAGLGRFLAVDLGFGPEISDRIISESAGNKESPLQAIRRLFSAEPNAPDFSKAADAIEASRSAATEKKSALEKRRLEAIEKNISALEDKERELSGAGNLILKNLQAVDSEITLARQTGGKSEGALEFRKKEGILVLGLD